MKIRLNDVQYMFLKECILPNIDLDINIIKPNVLFEIDNLEADMIRDECMEYEVLKGLDSNYELNAKGEIAVQLIDIFYN